MNTFKVGDKVRVTTTSRMTNGIEGVVIDNINDSGDLKIRITKGSEHSNFYSVGDFVYFLPGVLELIEDEEKHVVLSFDEVLEGDTIRVTYTHENGTSIVRSGVAQYLEGNTWTDSVGVQLFAKNIRSVTTVAQLLDRSLLIDFEACKDGIVVGTPGETEKNYVKVGGKWLEYNESDLKTDEEMGLLTFSKYLNYKK